MEEEIIPITKLFKEKTAIKTYLNKLREIDRYKHRK
jgi:hypothetical protein